MKYLIIALMLIFKTGNLAALSDTLSLQQKIQASALVFEGRVISDSSFWNYNETTIYTLKNVLVLKQFKGSFASDTVTIIVEETGAKVGGVVQQIMDNGSLVLYKNTEGIFFCKPVNTELFQGIKENSVYQINLRYNCDGFIFISCAAKIMRFSHRASSCDGMIFDDVPKELYGPIEEITGQKYKRIGLNCLEQSEPKK